MFRLLAGYSEGVLSGILFTPAKGSETRERISNRGRDVKNKFNTLVDSINKKFDFMKKDVQDLAERGKEKIRSY